MSKPFFSIVIPTFNRSKIISRSVDSVLRQTFSDYEIIIIDNGSNDNTDELIRKKYKDAKIKYFYQEGSGSPANPRNKGIDLAKGRWICFLDSDDEWFPNKLEVVFQTIKDTPECEVICHNEIYFSETKQSPEKVLRYGPNSENMYKDMLIYGNRLSTSAVSLKKDFLKKFKLNFDEDPNLATVEDYDLWLNLAFRNARFKFIKESLGYYYFGGQNLISYSEIFCTNLDFLLRKHVFHIQNFEHDNDKLWNFLSLRLEVCLSIYNSKNYLTKIASLSKTFFKSPGNFLKLFIGYSLKRINAR